MSAYLLDVNLLVALADASHAHHEAALDWFERRGRTGWASCDVTQNGLLRVLLSPRYPWPSSQRATLLELLREVFSQSAHRYIRGGVSLLDRRLLRLEALEGHRQVTDAYLLGFAVHHACRLATFDRTLKTDAVIKGAGALELIPA